MIGYLYFGDYFIYLKGDLFEIYKKFYKISWRWFYNYYLIFFFLFIYFSIYCNDVIKLFSKSLDNPNNYSNSW